MINIKPARGAGILSTKPLEGDTLIIKKGSYDYEKNNSEKNRPSGGSVPPPTQVPTRFEFLRLPRRESCWSVGSWRVL